MIKAEWKYLLKHKFMMLVLVVLIFVPSIYSVTFLKSMWDPYGKMGDLPVAVINNDKSVKYQGTKLSVGKDLTKNLKKSDAMKFEMVKSKKEANAGLKDGKYYMAMTIPKNFSKNATTLLDKHPKKMVIHYTTSAGHNYIAQNLLVQLLNK
jgi:YhgE/Pip N-terminal domain